MRHQVQFALCLILASLLLYGGATQVVIAQNLGEDFFQIGASDPLEYYVDPLFGSDSNSGTTRLKPKRSVTSLWNAIPDSTPLTRGVRINLLPGTYESEHLPNYWEQKTGTQSAPIILQSADGFGTVLFSRDINMAQVSYFYLLGILIQNRTDDGYGDAFHCERCSNILLRGNSLNGAPQGRDSGEGIAHETVKFNQSQYIYIENNNIQGADDNGIDLVAVQYGHIVGNRIHDTDGWCMYAKGGSSYLLIESNIAYSCGEGGITAGQGTGFEFMESPWIRFEANYIKIVNNIIHDIDGAALGVNGGYGILLAHNTAFRIGSRSHLIEVVFGERSCDGDSSACAARRTAGGWGPSVTGSEASQPIGNQDVIIANNILYNPSGFSSGSQHFAIYGPRTPTVTGIPSPQRSDTQLIIKGNIVWNGTSAMPLGVEDGDQGCQGSNPTCNQSQIVADNSINMIEPDFISPTSEDFRPIEGGVITGVQAGTIPNHTALDSALNPIPEGVTDNAMVREFSGSVASARPPGAIVSAASSIQFPSSGGSTTPGNGSNQGPSITRTKVTAKRTAKRIKISSHVSVSDSDGVSSVLARVMVGGTQIGTFALKAKGSSYVGKTSVKTKAKKISVSITATDALSYASTSSKAVKVR